MQVVIETIVDVTETGARRGDDKFLVDQQNNYNTVIQTIGLRVNPNPISCETSQSNHKIFGKNKVWKVVVEFEYQQGLTTEMLTEDFHLVPFIPNLNETYKITKPVFITKGNDTNIIFQVDDK